MGYISYFKWSRKGYLEESIKQIEVEEKGFNEVVSIIDYPPCRAGDEQLLRELYYGKKLHTAHQNWDYDNPKATGSQIWKPA